MMQSLWPSIAKSPLYWRRNHTTELNRAAILRKALGQAVHATVIGSDTTPEAIALAEAQRVIIMTAPRPAD